MNKKCNSCNSEMIEKGTKEIGRETYYLLYCEKCKRQVARNQ